jgi:hypothetical protein
MGRVSKLRQWINRDDGRYYQAGNRDVGTLEAIGLLTFVCSLFLWQLHSKTGLSGVWAYGAGVGGLLLAILGLHLARKGPGA